jgi:hypothetical protein
MRFQEFVNYKNKLSESTSYSDSIRKSQNTIGEPLNEEMKSEDIVKMVKGFIAYAKLPALKDKYLELYQKYGEKTGQAAKAKLEAELDVKKEKLKGNLKGMERDKQTLATQKIENQIQNEKDKLANILDKGKEELVIAKRDYEDTKNDAKQYGLLAPLVQAMDYEIADETAQMGVKMNAELRKLAQQSRDEALLQSAEDYDKKMAEKRKEIETAMSDLESSGKAKEAEGAIEEVKGSKAFKKVVAADREVSAAIGNLITKTDEWDEAPEGSSKTSISYAVGAVRAYLSNARKSAK